MLNADLLALGGVAALLVVSGLPFCLIGVAHLVELRKGREARESQFLALVAGLVAATASPTASALVAESESAVLVESSYSGLPDACSRVGGPSVVSACGQPVVGGDAVGVDAAGIAVNGLSSRTVHTVPQARSTDGRRLPAALAVVAPFVLLRFVRGGSR